MVRQSSGIAPVCRTIQNPLEREETMSFWAPLLAIR